MQPTKKLVLLFVILPDKINLTNSVPAINCNLSHSKSYLANLNCGPLYCSLFRPTGESEGVTVAEQQMHLL